MSRIRITQAIADDYQSRDVYETCWRPGSVDVECSTLADMIRDADYQANWTEYLSNRMRQAYRSHRDKLIAAKLAG